MQALYIWINALGWWTHVSRDSYKQFTQDKLIQYGYKLWVEGIRLGYQNAAANVSTNYAANDGGYCDILRKKMALSTNLKAMAMTLVINSTIPASRHCNYQEMDRKSMYFFKYNLKMCV